VNDEGHLTERGQRAAREMAGEDGVARFEQVHEFWEAEVDPDLARIFTDFTMNGMYGRQVLPIGTRQLCAVAALTVLQRDDQLASHLRVALRHNPHEFVREVIVQMAMYGGFPVVLSAMKVLRGVLAEDEFCSEAGD
jgi:4-carboxymuconolactone decarboxylase